MPKIIGGQFKGRRLKAFDLSFLRPTLSKVKESVFNKLGSVEDLYIVDLFAGCGNLGFEAISRGAAHCIFVDNSRRAINIINENAQLLGVVDKVELRCMDALRFLRTNFKADIIFIDPPYNYKSYNNLLIHIGKLDRECKIILECNKSVTLPLVNELTQTDSVKIGDTIVYFYEK